jgi:hypothetical protein
MMSAHEVDAMAAIARADIDGVSMRGQRLGNGPMVGGTSRGRFNPFGRALAGSTGDRRADLLQKDRSRIVDNRRGLSHR